MHLTFVEYHYLILQSDQTCIRLLRTTVAPFSHGIKYASDCFVRSLPYFIMQLNLHPVVVYVNCLISLRDEYTSGSCGKSLPTLFYYAIKYEYDFSVRSSPHFIMILNLRNRFGRNPRHCGLYNVT